jgi:hypothetical protein
LALDEIEKYNFPIPIHFEIANKKGEELAKKLNADVFIVQMGTRLMDLKLGQAFTEKRLQEHVKMSSDAAKEFLSKYDIDEKIKIKILNCIEAHHAKIPFICKEAEIVANADCYRFLTPRGFLAFLHNRGKLGVGLDEALNNGENKADEKAKIVSLGIARKELDPYYFQIKKFIKDARTFV